MNLNNIILWSIQKLNNWYQKRTELFEIKNPHKFEDLSPFDKADENGKYSEALRYGLDNSKINNIAISGSFGAGKSSFLRTFEKNHPKWEYLNISLATFKEANSADNPDLVKSQLIEKSILQQIFYKVKKNTIPRSKFSRIENISTKSLILQSILFTSWFLSILAIFHPEKVKKLLFFNDLNLLDLINYDGFKVYYSSILIIIFISLSCLFIFSSFKNIKNLQLKKFSLLKGEAEIEETNKEGSALNENIDEILYFFEATKYNVVIFEDLDRFRNIDVFIKLREINDLINKSDQIVRKIVFIYAIRDDMFDDDGRTKFFEFIIPIIPYINQSNSYEKLLVKFKDHNIEKEFLSDMSIYINDMRLLNNIYNEFITYDHKIENVKDKTKLLAMVIYKNLYPSDFSLLHKNKGVLANIIQKKNEYLSLSLKELNNEIVLIENEISEFQNQKEWLKDRIELRKIYLYELETKLGSSCYIDKVHKNIKSLIGNDEFDLLLNSKQLASNQHGQNATTFSEIENKVNSKHTYLQREKKLSGDTEKHVDSLKQKIEKIQLKKTDISRYSLRKLLYQEAVNDSFNEDIQDKKILKYMLQYGYIDEDFYVYISHFFPGSITEQDHEFWMAIKDKSPLSYEHNLKAIEELITKLRNKEFEHYSIFNYDLVDYILENSGKYPDQLSRLFTQLSNETEQSYIFIDSYFEFTEHKQIFIKLIVKYWNDIWIYINKNSEFSESKKEIYLLHILNSSEIDDISKLNKDHNLEYYLDEKPNFIKFASSINEEKVKQLLETLEIEIKLLNDLGEKNKGFSISNYIYENEHYEINEFNIYKIIKFKSSLKEGVLKKLKVSHYTTLKELNLTKLMDYVNDNLNEYVNNVFLEIETNTEESEETVIELLNKEEFEQEIKEKIILKESVEISNISKISNTSLWSTLFQLQRVSPTWDNVLHYYELSENMIDSYLSTFLNNKNYYKQLSTKKIDNEDDFDDDLNRNLRSEILLSESIDETSYEYLIKSVRPWKDLNVSELSSRKIDLIIENNILNFTQKNINYLLEAENNKEVLLIEKNINEFIEEQDNLNIPTTTFAKLFRLETLNLDNKIKIINQIESSLLLEDPVLQVAIYELVLKEPFKLPDGLIDVILTFDGNTDEKVNILSSQIKYLDKNEIAIQLNKFGEQYSEIKPGHKPIYLNKTNENHKLVRELKKINYISTYSENFRGIKINLKRP